MVNMIENLSTLTTIPEKYLTKLFDKIYYVMSDAVVETALLDKEITEIDIGIGTLLISANKSEIKYKFVPNKKLEQTIKSAVINKRNILANTLESNIVDKITDTYKTFISGDDMKNNDKGIVEISRDEATKLVDNTSNELVSKILAENDSKQIKDLTSLFNLNIKKKNVLRLLKLNDLLDNVNDTVIERVNKRSDELTMKELIDILTTTQSIIEKTNKTIEGINEDNFIQLNQQNLNINLNNNTADIDEESRKKILDVVNNILKSADTANVVEAEIVEDKLNN